MGMSLVLLDAGIVVVDIVLYWCKFVTFNQVTQICTQKAYTFRDRWGLRGWAVPCFALLVIKPW